MTQPKINLTELRERAATGKDETSQWAFLPVTVTARDLLALIDTAEAAIQELAEHDDALTVGGSGDFYRLRASLDRYQP